MSYLEKGKPTPLSPYFFHLCSKNEFLKDEEIDEIEAAWKYLELGISSDDVEIVEEEESK